MKRLFTTILIFNTLVCLGQTDIETQNKLKMGVIFSPDVYLNSTSIPTSQYTGYSISQTAFNFTTGITAQLNIKPKIDIVTGISYSKKDYSGTWYCHVCDLASPSEPDPIIQRYLEIPILARLRSTGKKIDLHIETGFNSSYLIKYENTIDELELSNRKLLFNGQIGIGLSREFGSRFNVNLTGIYRHSIFKFSNDMELRPISIGIMTGINYKIKGG